MEASAETSAVVGENQQLIGRNHFLKKNFPKKLSRKKNFLNLLEILCWKQFDQQWRKARWSPQMIIVRSIAGLNPTRSQSYDFLSYSYNSNVVEG
jgi:hypothetical protein